MNRLITLAFLLILCIQCKKEEDSPVPLSFDSTYTINFENPVQDKNFFLLSMIQRSPEVHNLILADSTLSRIGQKYSLGFESARQHCAGEVTCVDQLLKITEPDKISSNTAFSALAEKAAMQQLLKEHLRPSGLFIRYDSLSDAAFLSQTLNDAMAGLNNILSVYGLGKAPRYNEIDRVTFDVSSQDYQQEVDGELQDVTLSTQVLFFEPTLFYAMALLQINNRDEAGRYEVMHEGENKAVFEHMAQINWQEFDYSLILVLGDSPNSPGDFPNISLGGMARSDHGVRLFQEGKAPILAFSGGHVRPFQTEFSEAIEMKKYVMEEYGIPANQILVDPHARHTTTNFRNIARMVYRYGIPADKKAIVTTATGQSAYVTGQVFHDRCLEELGYLPAQILERINDIEVEFLPKKISLQADSSDPLDP